MRQGLFGLVAAIFAATPFAASAASVSYTDLATFQAAAGPLVLFNFEFTGDGGAPTDFGEIGSTYSSRGLEFAPGNFFEDSFVGPVSGAWGWGSNNADGVDRVFEFTNTHAGVRSVGVHNVLCGGEPNGSLLQAFGGADALLGSVLSDGVCATTDFVGLVTDQDILRVRVNVVRPNGWGLDDLYVGEGLVNIVPEPGSLALLGLGVAGFGALRRRQG